MSIFMRVCAYLFACVYVCGLVCVCVRLWALLLDQDVCAYVAVQMMHEKKREKMESHF